MKNLIRGLCFGDVLQNALGHCIGDFAGAPCVGVKTAVEQLFYCVFAALLFRHNRYLQCKFRAKAEVATLLRT